MASIDWIVNFIGSEGYRESFKVTGDDAKDLAQRREKVLVELKMLGAMPDIRKPIFEDNGVKRENGGGGSKLLKKIGKDIEPSLAEEVKKAMKDAEDTPETKTESIAKLTESGLLTDEQAKEVSKSLGVEAPPSEPVDAPAPTTVVANRPNKLARFTKPEKKGD
jgi:hypothetical protein